jgi:Family of unknown function (DUF5706)/Protein of unknown function (DUF3616)
MAQRLTSNGRAVVRQDERSASRRRRGGEEPQLEPPLTNGADRRAAGVSASARRDDVTADVHKPKKKSKKKKSKKKRRPAAAPQGLHESPSTYHPGPASPSVSSADATADAAARPALSRPPVVKKNTVAKKDRAGTERGIETMYRGAYRTQLDLTNLADTKANIMISINGLILSVVLAAGGFIANLEPWLLVPVGALVLTCITAMFFAVQAARPRLPKTGELTPEDFISGDANVLFFQDLASLPEDEYVGVMDRIMRDRELTYHHMTRHLYGLGVGLNRKFALLKLAYSSFVFGIIGSAALFFVFFGLTTRGSQVSALAAPPLAAAERSEDPPQFRELAGVYEPSAVHQLADGRFIVVEDEERHPIDLLTLQEDGGFSAAAVFPKELFDKDGPAADFRKLDDLEALDVDDRGRVYALTSHSRTGKGNAKQEREKLVRFELNGDELRDPRVVQDLKEQLMAAHPVLKEAAEIEDVKDGNGLNIEGLAFDPARERLLVGFRGPLVDGKAMLVAIENVDEVFETGAEPRIAEQTMFLDLGGEGIRGMTYDPRLDGFLIISGPLEQVDNVPFRLWFWQGQADQPQRVTVPGLNGFEHAEGVTPVRWRGEERILIVSDDGDMDAGKSAQYLMLEYDQLVIEAGRSTTQ